MVTVFWGADGFIHIDFLEPGITNNSDRYIRTLKHLKWRLKMVWKHKNILLQHDNTRPHTLHKPPCRQLRSWMSPLYHIHHTVQTWCHATSTFFQKRRKAFVDVCMTQMKRWKGLSGSGWRNKVWSSFMTTFINLSIVGRSVCGEWRWLCGEVNTGNKRAPFKNYFPVWVIEISVLKLK
jgi:hypothetical protein